MSDRPPDPLRFDVGQIVSRTVVSLYSSLVTRPTGRAVRIAIESQLAELASSSAVSIIDLSRVSLLDFSCADEVVAKLISRRAEANADSASPTPFFVLHGLGESHRGPIEAVLERHRLAIVARTAEGVVELLGITSSGEASAWGALQEQGVIAVPVPVATEDSLELHLGALAARGLAYRDSGSGAFHALTSLAASESPPPDPTI